MVPRTPYLLRAQMHRALSVDHESDMLLDPRCAQIVETELEDLASFGPLCLRPISYYNVRCKGDVDFRCRNVQFPGQRAQDGIVYLCGHKAEKVKK
jgi:hypothetical protein